MSLLLNWLESLSINTTITDRCVRQISPKSSCMRCISHCQSQALSLDHTKVIVDEKKCTSCGECTVVCPVAAVEGNIPKRTLVNGMFAYSKDYCPTVKELLIYRKKGVKTLSMPDEVQDEEWAQVISGVNHHLEQLGMEPLSLDRVGKPEERSLTRRELFVSVRKKGQSLAKELTPASWRMGIDTWSLPANYPDMQFYQIELDMEKCSICQVCFKLCPKNVFTMSDSELRIDHQNCINCSLCSDICLDKAISVSEKISEKTPTIYPLVAGTCVRCKSSFYSFQPKEHCHICANKPIGWL